MINTLTENLSKKLLKNQKIGRLGCVLEGNKPYVVPVAYLFEEGNIYIHSFPGQKISAMRQNPKVCLQVDELADDGFEWQSVIVFGEFEEIRGREKKTKILYSFYEKFPRFTPVEANLDAENSLQSVIVFCINIEHLTGVSEGY
jgi:nitroimidazol reductase NimA-like FMN-containing flavoprotein (pyridoxamine 5'-phosphate oxidase superfamily)